MFLRGFRLRWVRIRQLFLPGPTTKIRILPKVEFKGGLDPDPDFWQKSGFFQIFKVGVGVRGWQLRRGRGWGRSESRGRGFPGQKVGVKVGLKSGLG